MTPDELKRIIDTALAEDIGTGDVTTALLVPERANARLQFVAREPMIACGTHIPAAVYQQLGTVRAVISVKEGQKIISGQTLVEVEGSARILLTGERAALNLMQRACGVATLTAQYVETVRGTKATILDTRKTMPGLRALDKYAVTVGGGQNHRMRLDGMVLIKDNHIALCGGVAAAIGRARAGTDLPIEVECDSLFQVEEALAAKPDRILLDNMNIGDFAAAVKLVAGRIKLEASGGVSLETVNSIAQTGVDYVSVGKLTHSARAMDIGADIVFQ